MTGDWFTFDLNDTVFVFNFAMVGHPNKDTTGIQTRRFDKVLTNNGLKHEQEELSP